ncbi:leucine-rich repeat-containing protein [Oscillatoria nigro-viridis PCC 7112]|uniref:Leucine-rich repeat-containing protein n=1 Tax=Phormidium nigroviride PCC 7112 TaxID=179408 RepID=K9VIU1_9CYAN|nr:leucine-rich repeat-containing protein [Oscillatoria nigro-viridis PCC 7112]
MSESQADRLINFSSFADWCQHKDSLSESARHTVKVLLNEAGTFDCNEAEKVLLNLTTLNLGHRSITNFTSLSALTNLTALYLQGSQINDIASLSALTNLTYLNLESNQITDITPLSALTNLTYLNLNHNQITDITPLSGLTNLTILSLEYNQITDITGLSALTNLTDLCLGCNQITDITGLLGLTNLTRVSLNNNEITDVTPLSALTNLTKLGIENQEITDISPLSALTNLTELSISDGIIDISPLSALTNLTELFISEGITDISPLSALTNLTKLSIIYNDTITEISPLSALTNLTSLYFLYTQITDITALSALTNLTYLYLSDNQITDITALSALTNLTYLNLSNNQITDIAALSALTNLTYLNLSNNQITDITALSALTNLTELHLETNQITDLNLSIELTQKYLTLSTTPIDSPTAIETAKKLYAAIGLEAPEVIVCSSPQVVSLKILQQLKTYSSSQPQRSSDFEEIFQSVDVGSIQWLKSLFDSTQMSLEIEAGNLVEWGTSLFEELFQSVDVGLNPVLWEVLWHAIILKPDAERILLFEFDTLAINYSQSVGIFHSHSNYLKRLTSSDLVKEIHLTEFLISKFGVTLDEKAQELFRCKQQLFEDCGWIFPFEKVCLICDRPLHIRFDAENRLHAEGEPAIAFADGYSLYFHHGVKLPEKYGKVHPDLWQAEWLLSESNAELRRVLIERIGYDRICCELQAVELDSWVATEGYPYQQYTLLKIDNADVEPIYLLKMTCPSTGHIHALRVPPNVLTAQEAIRWVNWDIDPEEFSVQT